MKHLYAQTLGEILLSEQEDPFFQETINELLMKVKLTYSDISEFAEMSRTLDKEWTNIRTLEDELLYLTDIEENEHDIIRLQRDLSYYNQKYRDGQIQMFRQQKEIQEEMRERTARRKP